MFRAHWISRSSLFAVPFGALLFGIGGQISPAVAADVAVSIDCELGCPVMSAETGGRVVHRYSHSLGNNPKTKFADWVAYVVDAKSMDGTRDRRWKPDPKLPAEATLEPAGYKGANAAHGYDRGH
jgi:endonuclease G